MWFKYERITYKDGRDFIKLLQKMGLEGWELIAAGLPDDEGFVAYLKLEVDEKCVELELSSEQVMGTKVKA